MSSSGIPHPAGVDALSARASHSPESGIVEVLNYGIGRQGIIPLWAGEGDVPTPAFICDAATAALAVKKYFKPQVIVPMHYGTWPILANEAAVQAAFAGDSRLKIMKPGEAAEL